MVIVGLLAAVALFALPAAASAAPVTIKVTSQEDETLSTSGKTSSTCETEGGVCTLRAAVELADYESAEATIELPEGKYTESLSPSEIVAYEDAQITILGAGAAKTIVAGEGHADVFEVYTDSALTLDGVTVEHGSEFEGGGIYASHGSSLVLENSLVTENDAYIGGGVYGEAGASVAILNSTISDNEAYQSGGGVAQIQEYEECGEAAHSSARHAHSNSLGLGHEDQEGLTVLQSTVEENAVVSGVGGGIYVGPQYCDAVLASAHHAPPAHPKSDLSFSFGEPSLTVVQSTIARNGAYDDEGDGGIGGGVYEEAFIDDPIIDSTIAENFATFVGAGVAIGDGYEDMVSDTVFDNTIEPEEETSEEDAKPNLWGLRHSSHSASRARHDAVGEILPGANLAADPDAEAAIELRNTIVAEPNSETNNCEGDVESLKFGSGYNLDYPSTPEEASDTCGMSEEDHDLVGKNPELDPKGLQSNGGPTQTIALLSSSPAIGFVPIKEDCEEEGNGPALANEHGEPVPVDQRGEKRPGIPGKECDIGAYEYQQPPAPKVEPVTVEPVIVPPAKEEPKKEVLAVKITSSVQCASLRDITIHIQNVKQFGIVSAVVSIDGKDRRTLTGKHLSTGINLRGLPAGTFTVEIVARTRSGHTLHGKRVYHTCHTKLPGHSYLRL